MSATKREVRVADKGLSTVVLQKIVENRKRFRKEVSYAATPKISAMNLQRLLIEWATV